MLLIALLVVCLYLIVSKTKPSEPWVFNPPKGSMKLLLYEKEKLKRDLSVYLDRQYSYWQYANYHHTLESITADVDRTTKSLQQVDELIHILTFCIVLFLFFILLFILFLIFSQGWRKAVRSKRNIVIS